MSTELLATYSGLGTRNGEEYYRGEDCVACVKDLIRSLRGDDPQCTVRRQLGAAQTLQKDLIPLLEQCTDADGVLKGDLIRLMVNLTQPAFLCFNNEYPVLYGRGKKDLESVKSFMETEHHLRSYKEAFTRPRIMNVLGTTLAYHCQKDWEERDDDDTTMIERILLLIRNILHVVPENGEEKRTLDDVTLHDQIIWNMHMNGIDELLIFLASNEEERHWCMHVLEVVFLMLREQMPDVLAKCGRGRSREEQAQDDKILADLLKEEDRKKKRAVKLQGSRHSRFGGTFMASSTPSISDNPQVFHKPLSRIGNFDYDAGKTAKRKPVSRRPVPDLPKKRLSTYSIRMALKEFCIQFLECCYNPILRVVKDNIQHQRAMENDDTYYLWAVRFFMQFSHRYDFRVEVVGETLTMQTVHYIIQLVGGRYENMMVEKNVTLARQHSARLHYAVEAYRVILEYIEAMSVSEDPSLVANAKIMQSNIFYHSEYRELFISLLRSFTPQRSTKDLLTQVVETLHIYLRMLENYNKGGGRMVVQAKRKKKKTRAPRHRISYDAEVSHAGRDLSKIWSVIETRLPDGFAVNCEDEMLGGELDLPDLHDDDGRGRVIQRIREDLLDKNYSLALATMRMARAECPGDVFGGEDPLLEEEIEALKAIFLNEQYGQLLPPPSDQEESDAEPEEEEPTIESYEIDFDLNRFLHKLTASKVIQNMCYLLGFHATNSDLTNHCLAKMIYRIAVKLKLAPLFYQIRVFLIFQEILSSSQSRYKELQKLGKYLISGFFHMCESNPMMFAELLFWRTPADCIDLTEGYGSLQMQRERKKNRNVWSREDEHELTELFEQYKDEEDIVGCIIAALSNPHRSRQGVASQLVKIGVVEDRKELKKRKSQRVSWSEEEDVRLIEMYQENEHLMQDGGELDIEAFAHSFEGKTAEDVKRRLIKLKLLKEKRKRKKTRPVNQSEAEGDDPDVEGEEASEGGVGPHQTHKKTKTRKKTGSKAAELYRKLNTHRKQTRRTLNSESITRLVREAMKQDMEEAVEWLQEYLRDEAKDREAEGNSADLCIVPIGEDVCSALQSSVFEELMSSLGLQPPDDTEVYWRIPEYLSSEKLHEAVSLLSPPQAVQDDSNNDDLPGGDCTDVQMVPVDDGTMDDSTVVAGVDDSTVVAGVDDSTVVAGVDDSTVVAGVDDSTVVAGVDDSTVVAGVDDSTVVAGVDDSTVVAGVDDSTVESVVCDVDMHHDDSMRSCTMDSNTADNTEIDPVGVHSDLEENRSLGSIDNDSLREDVVPSTSVPKKRLVVWSDEEEEGDSDGEGLHNQSTNFVEAPKAKKPNLESSDEED